MKEVFRAIAPGGAAWARRRRNGGAPDLLLPTDKRAPQVPGGWVSRQRLVVAPQGTDAGGTWDPSGNVWAKLYPKVKPESKDDKWMKLVVSVSSSAMAQTGYPSLPPPPTSRSENWVPYLRPPHTPMLPRANFKQNANKLEIGALHTEAVVTREQGRPSTAPHVPVQSSDSSQTNSISYNRRDGLTRPSTTSGTSLGRAAPISQSITPMLSPPRSSKQPMLRSHSAAAISRDLEWFQNMRHAGKLHSSPSAPHLAPKPMKRV